MSKKDRLAAALRGNEKVRWKAAAAAALEDPEIAFAGQSESRATNTAGDLIRIYEMRRDYGDQKRIEAHGVVELLDCLKKCSTETVVLVQPFLGPRSSVTAFWDSEDRLLGCITVNGIDTGRGKKSLDFALGKL
jgi:hypothetical protein